MKFRETCLMLGGFPIARTTTAELTEQLSIALREKKNCAVFFANTNFIVKCQVLQKKLLEDTAVIVNDGVGVDIATWLIHREKFPENLNGTDFVPYFMQTHKHEVRVFLLGAKPGIALKAAKKLQMDWGISVVGCADGYEQARNTEKLIEQINASNANMLLVAMGNPYQEQWIVQHRHSLSATLFIGVGALLDFLAGDKPRAPKLIQKFRLEWLYRLALEPSRLVRRYTIDIIVFLRICFRTRREPLS